MAASTPIMFSSVSQLSRKTVFANRVFSFVKRARRLPGFPSLPVGSAIAIVLTTTVGAFGTGRMPLLLRLQFWIALVGFNAILWQLWFAYSVHQAKDWTRSAVIGAVLLNLPLPFEITLLLKMLGISSGTDLLGGWIKALTISAAILLLVLVAKRVPMPTTQSSTIEPGGLLARAGAPSPGALVAIRSEDHYCRVQLSDGRAPLIHYRFRDALQEISRCDGVQVHRSHWVANTAVVRAVRIGRRWSLFLVDGTEVPVSARFVPLARSNGLLARQS